MKYAILLTPILLWVSFKGFGQISSIDFNVEKDTVLQGEMYKNEVSVKIAPGDSLIKFKVGLRGFVDPTPLYGSRPSSNANTVLVKFASVHNDESFRKNVLESEYVLAITIKTRTLDTTFRTTKKYYVLPNPAYNQWRRDPSLKNALLFPETPARLADNNNIKEVVSKIFLEDQRGGVLAFSFVVNPGGTTSKLVIQTNTFASVTKEKLEGYIYKTQWTPANDQGKNVQSVLGVHIVR